jgi:hypothetical protein
MTNLLKGIALVVIFGGLLLGFWAFVEENTQPVLHAGTFHFLVVCSAALLIGPAVGITLGKRAQDWVRRDLNEMIERPYPARYQIVASLTLRYKAVYYIFLAAAAALPIGYGAFGATKLIDHRYNVLIGETTCSVEKAFTNKSNRLKLRLQCWVPEGPAEIEMIFPYAPAILPGEVTLPIYRGVLDSVFADGRNVSL